MGFLVVSQLITFLRVEKSALFCRKVVKDISALYHSYSGKPPCMVFHRTALASIEDAIASPHSAVLPMKDYSAEFCRI